MLYYMLLPHWHMQSAVIEFLKEGVVEFLAFGIFWPSLACGSGGTCRHKSRLSSVHFVLQEWYLRVDVDAKTGKDKKVLRDKFHRFLPAVSSMG